MEMIDSTSLGTKLPGSCTHFRFGSFKRASQDASRPTRLSSRASFFRSRISGVAMLICTRSRLSASGTPEASRISPRGAGMDDAATCWRVAFACHCLPCQTWTCAARTTMAAAKTPSTRWTTAIRLVWSIARRQRSVFSLDHDDLTVTRHSKPQPLLDQRRELVPTRRLTDLTFQLRPLRPEIHALAFELLYQT